MVGWSIGRSVDKSIDQGLSENGWVVDWLNSLVGR